MIKKIHHKRFIALFVLAFYATMCAAANTGERTAPALEMLAAKLAAANDKDSAKQASDDTADAPAEYDGLEAIPREEALIVEQAEDNASPPALAETVHDTDDASNVSGGLAAADSTSERVSADDLLPVTTSPASTETDAIERATAALVIDVAETAPLAVLDAQSSTNDAVADYATTADDTAPDSADSAIAATSATAASADSGLVAPANAQASANDAATRYATTADSNTAPDSAITAVSAAAASDDSGSVAPANAQAPANDAATRYATTADNTAPDSADSAITAASAATASNGESAAGVIVPSRSVTVQKNQYLDVVYPGSGWIYLGEATNKQLFSYFGCKLDAADTSFSLRSQNGGETLLHFYKSDALTSSSIEDYLAVIVEDTVANTNMRVIAPSYAEVVPPKPQRKTIRQDSAAAEGDSTPLAALPALSVASTEPAQGTTDGDTVSPRALADNTRTVIQTGDAAAREAIPTDHAAQQPATEAVGIDDAETAQERSAVLDAQTLLAEAQQAFQSQQHERALSLVQQYLAGAAEREDEALYLQGQVLESDSTVRDIRTAVESYDTLTRRFPASKLWQDAHKRSIYLRRFYIDIR